MRDLRLNTGNIVLQAREYEQAGDAVIFLHFGGGNLMAWQRVVPYFQDHFHLILVDLRDHGKSDKPQAGAHIDQMALDVVGVMQQLKLERAHIVGSSLGAEVGLSVAANYPERVISLVCEGALSSEYGPYSTWEGSEDEFKAYAAQTVARVRSTPKQVFPSLEALIETSKQTFEKYGWWNQYVEAFQAYDAFEVRKGQFTHSWQNLAMAEYLEHYFTYRFEEYYKRVKCPVLMLPGEEEFQNERSKLVMQGLIQLVRKGKIVAVPGWIHPYGWLINPDEMCKVVFEFLMEVDNEQ